MAFKEIKLPFKVKKPVLALGSHTKNTLCFLKDNLAILSPLHADLNAPKDFSDFEKDARYLLKKKPKIIAYDLHPEYQSTKYSLCLPTTYHLLPTQHHHSHIAACMLENSLRNARVIGVAFDGTGLGSDNTIWGAEFLLCDYKNFQRKAHLKEIPLLGQERAIREPGRLALVWLYALYRERIFNLDIPLRLSRYKEMWQTLKKMYLSGFNSPLASSMGRLFDAAGSLILGRLGANFEAELAIRLEKKASSFSGAALSYDFRILRNNDTYTLDPAPMFKQMISDLKAREKREKMAYRFHLTVAQMVSRVCLILRKETEIKQVALSGGVFQNSLLRSLSLDLLYKEGFQVFTQQKLPCTDASLSLGQAAIAHFRSG